MIHSLISGIVAFMFIQVKMELEDDLSLPKWAQSLLAIGIKSLQYSSCIYLIGYCFYMGFVELKLIK